MQELELLGKNAAQEPICLPDHPYVAALKDFGLDELVAGGIDAVSTTALSWVLSDRLQGIILPFAGPVIEKGGFYVRHLKKARDIYKTLTPEQKETIKFKTLFKQGIKEGMESMMDDITVHDPLYIAMMAAGLKYFPEIPPGALSALSYTIALFVAAGARVGRKEFLYWNKKRLLKNSGFEIDKYLESRFHIKSDENPEDLMGSFVKEFDLAESAAMKYHDRYFDNCLPSYSGRTAKLRLRNRDLGKGANKKYPENTKTSNSLQIVYTRAGEEKRNIDQCRYFPVEKEKIYFPLPEDMPWELDHIEDRNARKIAYSACNKNGVHNDIFFERTVAYNKELLVCTDKVDKGRPFYIAEIKTRSNPDLLMQGMRYMMMECPIVATQTTYGKSDIFGRD